MYRYLSMILLLVGVVACTYAYIAEIRGGNSASQLRVLPSDSLDIGSLEQGEKREVEFTLLNPGPNELEIVDVQVNCSCSSVVLSSISLKKGDSCSLKFTYDSTSRRGAIDARCSILYSAPVDQAILERRIHLTGRITPKFQVKPETLEPFSEGLKTQRVVLAGEGLEIDDVSCSKIFFQSNFSKSGEDEYTIEIRFAPESYIKGSDRSMLTIRTNSKHQPIVNIPLGVNDGI